MGTAAAGAAALGAAAGAYTFAPHLAAAGKTLAIPVASQASSVGAKAQSVGIPSSWDYTADVVVVGNGGAGTAAAIAAYDGGASVLILEKAPQGLDGGNTGVCGGATRIGTPLTDFITVVDMCGFGNTPLDVVTAYCTEVTNLPNWIQSLGGSMIIAPNSGSDIPVSFYAGHVSPDFAIASATIAVPSFSYPGKGASKTGSSGGGKDFFGFLDYCRSTRGIPILYQTPANQLIQNPTTNEILGVIATDWTGQDIYVRANKAVILACGGYENNPEILANYQPNTPRSEYSTFYGTPYNTGDGIYMAQQVGAKLWHMSKKESHALACRPGAEEIGGGMGPVQIIGYGIPSGTTYPVIYVNRNGTRFMNEYFYPGHTDQTKEWYAFEEKVLATDGVNFCDWPNIPFYAIFDSGAMSKPLGINAGSTITLNGQVFSSGYYDPVHNIYSWSSDNSVELAKGWIVTADTPADLGAKITCRNFFGDVVGMDAAGLDATVTRYNAMCAAGVDTDFGRPASTLKPFTTGPFYAMELCEEMTNTDGGPAHDKYNRTLDTNNNPIPRLYSAGELGSLWSRVYIGAGNMGEAVVTGKIAGTSAAALPSWE